MLSAAICTKNGKTLVSRQFVEMTRIRIEGLLAAFPKLRGTGAKQHTYVETENVRYLYHPLEQMVLLLITNRSSNIVEVSLVRPVVSRRSARKTDLRNSNVFVALSCCRISRPSVFSQKSSRITASLSPRKR